MVPEFCHCQEDCLAMRWQVNVHGVQVFAAQEGQQLDRLVPLTTQRIRVLRETEARQELIDGAR
jgi:hypothetical protein